MKSIVSQRAATILTLPFVFILFLITVDGCKKDSDPTGPVDSPTIPSVNGHWVGSGSETTVDLGKMNFSMAADIVQAYVQQPDSKFSGSLSYTWTWSSGTRQTNRMDIKGTVSTSRQITIEETGGVATWGSPPVTAPVESRLWSTYTGCVLSANGDTISYRGPTSGSMVFVLVRQK